MTRGPSSVQPRSQRGQTLANAAERVAVGVITHPERQRLGGPTRLGEQALLGALQREALVVEQGLDPLHELEVPSTINALPRRVFLGPQELELRLPVAEHVRGHTGDGLHLADAIVEPLGAVRGQLGCVLLIRCLSPFDGLNVSTLRAVISIESPVCGLRPRRDALRRIRKCPNPTIFTSSPFSKQRKMMSKTLSTTDED